MTFPSLITAASAVVSNALASPTDVHMTPNPNSLPGYGELVDLTNGIGGWALIAAMLGIVIGAIMWAFGHYSQNYQQAYNGRRGVLVSALAALLIGGAPQIINTLVHQGGTIH